MERQAKIKSAFERNAKVLQLKPSKAQGTAVTKVRLVDGLTCEIEDGPWRLTADMHEKHGGDNTGPNPGVLGRGALGTCLAIGYAQWAAIHEMEFSSIEVEIQADYDARGEMGVADVSPGYSEIRYVVTVETTAPEAEVVRLLDDADKRTPYLAVFREPQSLKRQLHIVSPTTTG